MGKKFLKLIILVLVFFIIMPIKISALSINSNYYIYNNKQHSLKLKNVDAFFNFFAGSQIYNGNKKVYISGNFDNPYYLDDLIYTKILFFDENKTIIAECDSSDSLLGTGYSSISFYCGVEEKDFFNNKSISDIKFYKILISENVAITLEDKKLYNSNSMIDDESYYKVNDNYNDSDVISNSDKEYYINNYNINVIVNENNSLNITEKIGAYFNVNKHGIFRKIPFINEVIRMDGTSSKNRALINDIKVSDQYSLLTDNGYKVIKIGDPNRTIIGQQNYEINYLYSLGKDKIDGFDELYFNLIGDEWDTSISNITFNIMMPKEFDKSKLGFSSGKVGSIDSSKIKYSVNGRVISGNFIGTLNSNETLTIRLELPEGYFQNIAASIPKAYYLMYIIPMIGVLISIILWKRYGKDEVVVETVEFYPPQGFNSLEIGYLYKGYADDKDVVSLLIYLANKGYIKIIESSKKTSLGESEFKIKKLKEYDGSNINEKIFLDGLFGVGNKLRIDGIGLVEYNKSKNHEQLSILETDKDFKSLNIFREAKKAIKEGNYKIQDNGNTVATANSLENKFYMILSNILSNINNKRNNNILYDKKAKICSIFLIMFIILSIITTIFVPTILYGGRDELGLTIFVGLFFATIYIIIFAIKIPIFVKIINMVFVMIFMFFLSSALPISDAVINDYRYLVAVIFGIICVCLMLLFLKLMKKRTKYGIEVLGKIKGFKNYLETVEKDRLEHMVMANPTYFYDILPYTYVLGVSDKWIKKFETITMQLPNWYDGGSSLDTFGRFINSAISSVTRSMTSQPSSSNTFGNSSSGSSGGTSSGGGFSGGGSGGGGGGSW